jgi:hypothetical protein
MRQLDRSYHGRGASKRLDGEDDLAEWAALNKVTQSIRRFGQRKRLCHNGLNRTGLK